MPLTSSGSALRDVRPEFLAAAAGDVSSDPGRPFALCPELSSPGPEPPRDEVEGVFVGESNGAVTLMGDARAEPRGLTRPHLGDGDLERGITAIGRAECVGRRAARRRGMSRQERQLMLDRLKAPDRSSELLAVAHVLDGLGKEILEPAGHLGGPDKSSVESRTILGKPIGWRSRD